jgi:hypothetical protein
MGTFTLIEMTARPGGLPALVAALSEAWSPRPPDRLRGCWSVDLGVLNRVIVLAEGDQPVELPLGTVQSDIEVTRSVWHGLPDLMLPSPGKHGPCYELRCYDVLPDRIADVHAAFLGALPTRCALSPLLIAMQSADGAPRFAHIWPYAGLDARQAIRADAVATGQWPPPVSSFLAGRMTAEIMWPLTFSPLQ